MSASTRNTQLITTIISEPPTTTEKPPTTHEKVVNDEQEEEDDHNNDSSSNVVIQVADEDEKKPLQAVVYGGGNGRPSTLRQIVGTVGAAAYFMTCSSLLLFVMNFVHERVPTSLPPLPDLGHDLTYKLHPEFLGDIAMGTMYFLLFCTLVFSRSRWQIATRFLFGYGSLYLLRITTISVTSLPATENHCYYKYQHIQSFAWNTFIGFISLGSLNIHCGDLMFSGHACSITLIMLSFWCYFSRKWLMNILVTIIGFLGFVFIIGTRSHYTVDVVVAFYFTIFVYKLMPDNWDVIIAKVKPYLKRRSSPSPVIILADTTVGATLVEASPHQTSNNVV